MGLIDNVNVQVTGSGDLLSTLQTYVTKILKPNIVDGKNILTQEMVSAKNTKYVIKYDYELEEDITVSSECVLEFDGGSISNGTLVGNDTSLTNITNKAIFKNIKFNGSFINSYISSEWFDGYTLNDLFEAISILSKSNINTYINIEKIDAEVIMDDRYNPTHPVYGLYLPSQNTITEFNGSTITAYTETAVLSRVLWIQDVSNVVVKNLNIIGKVEIQSAVEYQYAHAIYIQEANNIVLENIQTTKMGGDGIAIAFGYNLKIENCNFEYSGRNNISLVAGSNIDISGCQINFAGSINGKLPKAGIDIEPNNNEQRNSIHNIKLTNCTFNGNEELDIWCVTDDSVNHDIDRTVPLAEDTIIIDSCIFDKFVGVYNGSSGYTIKNSVCKTSCALRARNSKIINCIIPEEFRSDAAENWHSINNQVTLASDIFYKTAIPIECSANQVLKVDIFIPSECGHCHVKFKLENRPASNDFAENILHYYYSVDSGYLIKTLDEIQDKGLPQTAVFGNGAYSLAVGSNKSVVDGNIHTLYFRNINPARALRGVVYIEGESPKSNIQLYSSSVVNSVPGNVSFLLDIESYKVTLDYADNLANIGDYVNLYRGFNLFVANKNVMYSGSSFKEYDGALFGVNRSGTFAQKPSADNIYIGFRYFCTDKQTTEGATDGIEIIHKGNNIWVDALGRVVS